MESGIFEIYKGLACYSIFNISLYIIMTCFSISCLVPIKRDKVQVSNLFKVVSGITIVLQFLPIFKCVELVSFYQNMVNSDFSDLYNIAQSIQIWKVINNAANINIVLNAVGIATLAQFIHLLCYNIFYKCYYKEMRYTVRKILNNN